MAHRLRRTRVLVVLAAVILLAVACSNSNNKSGSATSTTSGGSQADTPQSGGTLTYRNTTGPRTLDPAKAGPPSGISPGVAYSAIFGLLVYDNQSGASKTWMAKSLTSPDEGKTWKLELRPGVTFSDGTPFDAAAVKATWDRIADPATGSPSLPHFTGEVASYTVESPTTLNIVLKAQDGTFPHFLAQDSADLVGSPTAFQKAGADFGTKPVGAGPFVVKSWVPNGDLVLTRNPTYWDKPRPYLDSLVFGPQGDQTQSVNQIITGAADLAFISESPTIKPAQAAGLQVLPVEQVGATVVQLNVTKPPLDDVNVRKALAESLDIPQMNQVIWGDVASPTILSKKFPYYDPSMAFIPQDMTDAQKLIDAYVAKTGHDVEVTFSTFAGVKAQVETAQVLQGQWQKLKHVKVNIQANPPAVQISTPPGAQQMAHNGPMTFFFPPGLYSGFRSGISSNLGGYHDPKLDAALDASRATTDLAAQAKATRDAIRIAVYDDYYMIPLHLGPFYEVASKKVHDIVPFTGAGALPDRLWIEH